MAGANLIALLDDIASLLDDVAVLAKVATKKTAGVLGDDLALNAQQVAGVHADRELPVVWAVFKGSLVNKLILVPLALALNAFLPQWVTPLLMVGGAYLCYEGFEKLAHRLLHRREDDAARQQRRLQALNDASVDVLQYERQKIKGAVKTDFILSAEIVAITLGTVASKGFWLQTGVLASVALALTVAVYGCVAGIVKLDDLGLYLSQRRSAFAQSIGRTLVRGAPYLMKALSVAGMVAMFLVGGGILVHGVPELQQAIERLVGAGQGGYASFFGMLASIVVGIIAGAMVLGAVRMFGWLFKRDAAVVS